MEECLVIRTRFEDERKYTTTLLQRGLRIGYGRAASLIDKLEAKGIVGPNPGGSKPREVLISNMDEYKD